MEPRRGLEPLCATRASVFKTDVMANYTTLAPKIGENQEYISGMYIQLYPFYTQNLYSFYAQSH